MDPLERRGRPARAACRRGGCTIPLGDLDAIHAGVRHEARPGRERARDVHAIDALLRAVPAPLAAEAGADTPFRVDASGPGAPPEVARAIEENAVGGRVGVVRNRHGVDLALDAVEDRSELRWRETREAKALR